RREYRHGHDRLLVDDDEAVRIEPVQITGLAFLVEAGIYKRLDAAIEIESNRSDDAFIGGDAVADAKGEPSLIVVHCTISISELGAWAELVGVRLGGVAVAPFGAFTVLEAAEVVVEAGQPGAQPRHEVSVRQRAPLLPLPGRALVAVDVAGDRR